MTLSKFVHYLVIHDCYLFLQVIMGIFFLVRSKHGYLVEFLGKSFNSVICNMCMPDSSIIFLRKKWI
ncbi:hypothetical protein EUGRSUZ_J00795 [Eucalyptus grandis]|uniref:Uncharacterized protein n=2 Tax=Eucalyptus grandis TaxID=71139 RepID=A0ACC3J3G8_EUCGR|nr:hypothetical protein EUGRSUZ_J00795 [Eucalyptus grandis]